MPPIERRRLFRFPLNSGYARKKNVGDTALLEKPVTRFARGGKECGLNNRPTKLQSQAFWASEFTLKRGTVLARALELPWCSTFTKLILRENDIVDILTGPGPVTLFVPINVAFDRLDVASKKALLSKKGHSIRNRCLRSHIIQAHWLWRDLTGSSYVPFAQIEDQPRHAPDWLQPILNMRIEVQHAKSEQGRVVLLGGSPARITCCDLRCHNGVIHVVDQLVLPPIKAAQDDIPTDGTLPNDTLPNDGLLSHVPAPKKVLRK